MTRKPKTIEIMLSDKEFEKLKTVKQNDRVIFEAENSDECFTIYYFTVLGKEKIKMIKRYENTTYVCLPFGYRLIFKADGFRGWYKANRKGK